jgi:hypothetical protein
MLLRHSLGLEEEAEAVESAVAAALDDGMRTIDIARTGEALGRHGDHDGGGGGADREPGRGAGSRP